MKSSPFKNASGEYIRQYRKACVPPLTQVRLCKCMTKHGAPMVQEALSRIENRQIGITDLQLLAIAKCLKVSIAQLVGEKPRKTTPQQS